MKRSVLGSIFHRSANLTIAFVLTLSSVSLALPMLFTQSASAAAITTAVELQTAVDSVTTGDVITLQNDITLSMNLVIPTAKTFTLDGNGHTITAAFSQSAATGNAAINLSNPTDVTISNVKLVNSGSNLHGINSFKGTLQLEAVSISNFTKYGLVVNGSAVTVNNIATAGNGWGGIDVDQSSTSNPAKLTVNGISNHSDIGNAALYGTKHLFIDDSTKNVSIVDTNNQYNITNLFNARFYKLKPAPLTVQPCSSTSVLNTTNLSSWNLSETQSAGSNQLTPNGLHVTATPSSGSYANEFSKAAGYYTTNFKLANAGVPTIDIASGYTGVRPSLQLGVDKDNNGTWDGYLVYEPWSYGAGNFWSSKDFGIGSGLGYTSFGTLNQYLTANPNANVTSIGYSLGSGVTGDAVITKLTAGCTDYTFNRPANTAPMVTFANPSPSENAYVSGVVTPHVLAADDYGMGSYYIRVWKNTFESGAANLVYNSCSSAPGAFLLGTSQDITCAPLDTTTLADGKYILSAQFLDGDNAWGQSLRTFYIDNTLPTITVKPGFVGDTSTKTFSNVSFSLYDANKVDKYVINGYTSDFTNNNYSDANFANIKNHLVQGENTLVLFDVAGNSVPYIFYYDNAAPSTSITYPAAGQVLSGTTLTITGTASDPNFNYSYCYLTTNSLIFYNGVAYTPGQEVGVRDANCVTTWSAVNTNGVIGGINLAGLPDGGYTINLVAYDKAKNNNAANPTSISFVIDNTAPVLTVQPIAPGQNETPIARGTTTDNTSPVFVNGVPAVINPTQNGDGTYNWSVTLPARDPGTYNLVVTSTDQYGNATTNSGLQYVIQQPDPIGEPDTFVAPPDTNTSNSQVGLLAARVGLVESATSDGSNADVLAAQTTVDGEPMLTDGEDATAGSNDKEESKSCGSFLGLCWYWWVIIVAGIVTIYFVVRSSSSDKRAGK